MQISYTRTPHNSYTLPLPITTNFVQKKSCQLQYPYVENWISHGDVTKYMFSCTSQHQAIQNVSAFTGTPSNPNKPLSTV